MIGSSGTSVAASATVYLGQGVQGATADLVQLVIPATQTYGHFTCFGAKPTAGNTDTFKLFRNGVAVPGATVVVPSGGTTPVTVAVSITLNPNDLIAVQLVNGNGAGGATWALSP
jgi:hypothetical protein